MRPVATVQFEESRKARGSSYSSGSKNASTVIPVSAFLFVLLLIASYREGLLDQKTVLRPSEFQFQTGNAYLVQLRTNFFFFYPDSSAHPTTSTLQIFEDGRRLGPAHALHSEIASLGLGRYSHWTDYLLFSSSDNTDPRSNGRLYSVGQPPPLSLITVLAIFALALSLAGIKARITATIATVIDALYFKHSEKTKALMRRSFGWAILIS